MFYKRHVENFTKVLLLCRILGAGIRSFIHTHRMNAWYANLQGFKNPFSEILGGGAERQRRCSHSVFHDDGGDFGFTGARLVIDEGMVELRQYRLFADVLHVLEIHHHVRAVVFRLTDAYVHPVRVPVQVFAQSAKCVQVYYS